MKVNKLINEKQNDTYKVRIVKDIESSIYYVQLIELDNKEIINSVDFYDLDNAIALYNETTVYHQEEKY